MKKLNYLSCMFTTICATPIEKTFFIAGTETLFYQAMRIG